MNKPGLAVQIIRYLADHDLSSAPTLGDLGRALKVPIGTALGERLRESRTLGEGFDIRCTVMDGRYRYWMPLKERKRAKAFIAEKVEKQQQRRAA